MIHTFSLNGCNIAIDGNSGSIHVLDDISFEILKGAEEMPLLETVNSRLGKNYSANEIRDAYEEIKSLKEQGMLFSEEKYLREAVEGGQGNDNLKALCLHISHDCNLACQYCFTAEGDETSGRKLMSEEIALAAVDYLVANSGPLNHIEIDFFGGEPLMNFEVVKRTVAYGREVEKKAGKEFFFTITTNGTLLDQEKIDFINEYMDNVVISIDGRKEIHDAVRRDLRGRGSYERILPLAKDLVSGRNGKSYFIRGTFTTRNKDFSKDVIHLADLGFKEISVEPVVGSGNPLYFREMDVPDILKEYEDLALEYAARMSTEKEFRFYHFNINVFDSPCLYKRVAACGAGFEYLAVAADGTLYPCHQFIGREQFNLGNVFSGICNRDMCGYFKQTNILTKEKCRSCWAKLFCSGGCHANAWFSNGSIEEPNEISCTLQKKRIECAVMIQALKASHPPTS